MQETNLADWLSAVGSVGAVIVSVGLFYASQRDRLQSERAQARNAALLVLPQFRNAASTLTWTLDRVVNGYDPRNLGSDEDGRIELGFLRRSFAVFEPVLPAIGILGVSAPATQQAFHLFRKLRDDVDSYYDDDFPQDAVAAFDGDAWAETQDLLKKADAKMSLAIAQMLMLLESKDTRGK
ncbi:hypothetical protein [Stenotrophomonas maltophilia]|uniref:hypothetical protein n=1 Tax=Stenotrophomonas maltophilia TaxID=40324 RepID=UPI0021C71467|nr:hypothetical protein [Stenotrophomonas maltophilia]MCU0996844.1 hypothetical protein [Stenotrophomonas maltophilia]